MRAQAADSEGPCRDFGPYRVERALGRGGLGTVQLATHRTSGAQVALKIVNAPATIVATDCLRREIRALFRLRHPGIVSLVDHDLEHSPPWYAMTLLRGPALSHWAQPQPSLAAALPALRHVLRLCDTLAYLHGEGFVHCDLKPLNVIVSDGDPILVDFGLQAKVGGDSDRTSGWSRETVEQGNAVGGTVLYMAPEQILNEAIDARVDLYALGGLLFELLTGLPPYAGTSADVMAAHLRAPVPRLSLLAPSLPSELDELIQCLMAKDPRDRLGHAGCAAAVLRGLGVDAAPWPGSAAPRSYVYRSPYCGRDELLDELTGRVRRLTAGGGGIVFVRGPSGSGKTRLLLELQRRLSARGIPWTAGECGPTDVFAAETTPLPAVPLAPLRPFLTRVVDLCRAASTTQRGSLLGDRAGVLATIDSRFAAFAGAAEGTTAPARAAPDGRARLLVALVRTLAGCAARSRLVVMIDDLQWADDLTLAFVDFLLDVTRLDCSGILLIAAVRSEEAGYEHRRLWSHPSATLAELHPLTRAEVSEITAHMLSVTQLPQTFVGFLARYSAGNPFFVAEYLRGAVAEGILQRDGHGRWLLLPHLAEREARPLDWLELEAQPAELFASVPLPSSLQALLARRLAGLSVPARALAEAAAVHVRAVASSLLSAATGLDGAALHEGIDELLRREVLVDLGESGLCLVHEKLGGAVVAGLDAASRVALHERWARLLESQPTPARHAADIARHWRGAGRADRAAPQALLAARQALAVYAARDARAALDQAISFLDAADRPDAWLAELHAQALDLRYQALSQLGDLREAEADASRLMALASEIGDREAHVRALRYLGECQFHGGNLDDASRLFAAALHLGQSLSAPEHVCEIGHKLGWILACQGKYEEAHRHFQSALGIPGLPDGCARWGAELHLGETFFLQGKLADALAVLHHLAEAPALEADPIFMARVQAALAAVHHSLADRRQALVLYGRALATFRHYRLAQDALLAENNQAVILMEDGEFAEAAATFAAVQRHAGRIGDEQLSALGTVQLASCLLRQARFSEGRRLAAMAEEQFRSLHDHRWLLEALRFRGTAEAALGDHDAATRCFAQARVIALASEVPFDRFAAAASELMALGGPLGLRMADRLWDPLIAALSSAATSMDGPEYAFAVHCLVAARGFAAATWAENASRRTPSSPPPASVGRDGEGCCPVDVEPAVGSANRFAELAASPSWEVHASSSLAVRELLQWTALAEVEAALVSEKPQDAARAADLGMLLSAYRRIASEHHLAHELWACCLCCRLETAEQGSASGAHRALAGALSGWRQRLAGDEEQRLQASPLIQRALGLLSGS
ncbi:MAG: AAA family ATPase [Candidatus Schekmanbacteria bacterium]|nr:AAA family ATPase [Candidatus Schekmanbacteria bacterium]